MLGEPFWYWGLAVVAALIVIVPPLAYWLETLRERRDRETWNQFTRRAR